VGVRGKRVRGGYILLVVVVEVVCYLAPNGFVWDRMVDGEELL